MITVTKLEFLSKLEKQISELPDKDIKKTVDYYAEMLDDYAEDGLDTDAAIEKMGGIEKIVSGIINEARGQNSASVGVEFNTGTVKAALLTLKIINYSLTALGILVFTLGALALGALAAASLIDGVISLFGGAWLFGIFTLGTALVCGAGALLAGVGAFSSIRYALKLLKERKKQKSKGENTNETC